MGEKDFDLMQWIKEKEESGDLYSAIPIAIGAKSGFGPNAEFELKGSPYTPNSDIVPKSSNLPAVKSTETGIVPRSSSLPMVEASEDLLSAPKATEGQIVPQRGLATRTLKGSVEGVGSSKFGGEAGIIDDAQLVNKSSENLLGKILSSKPAQFAARKILAPYAAYEEGKEGIENLKQGEYTDATASGLGLGSAVATIAGSPYALPLAAGSLSVRGAKAMGEQQASGTENDLYIDPLTGFSMSGEELNLPLKSGGGGTGNIEDFTKNSSEMPKKQDFIEELKSLPPVEGAQEKPVPAMKASRSVGSSDLKQMQDIVNLEKQQGADYAKRLEEAERQARENEALGLFSKAISQISGGVAQTKAKADLGKVDTSIADEFLKTSGKPLEELKRSIEMEKDDPNSAASKSIRAIAQRELKGIGMNIDLGNMSYAQIKNIFPEIERRAERLETAKYRQAALNVAKSQKEETKRSDDQRKAFTSLNKDIVNFRGNTAAKVAAENQLRISQALSLAERGDNLSPQELQLLASEIARVAQGGAPTISGIKEVTPVTLRTKLSKVSSFLMNRPSPAKANEFIKRNIQYLKEMQENSNNVIHEYQGRTAAAYLKRLNPEDKKEFMYSYPDIVPYTKFSASAIQDFANKHFNGDFKAAKAVLQQRIMSKEIGDE